MRASEQANSTNDTAEADAPDPEWAWTAYGPDEQHPWDLRLAGHLYRRGAFGGTWSELQRALSEGPQRTVDRLLQPDADVASFTAEFDDDDNAVAGSGSAAPLRPWWLRRMLETPFPLQERMTLFWHGHFGISGARVGSGRLMAGHVQTLRRHSLGDYGELLAAMLQDAAFFLGLDAAENRKSRPSEHLARQLLGGYGVGSGNFDDSDVRDTARALTGPTVLRNQLRYFEREHDAERKCILGQQGNWGPGDVARIIAGQPATARLLVGKLYAWLISETAPPSAELLEPLSASLATNLDVGRTVETMLRSNLFYSPLAYRQRVKSPVEYALGIIRPLEATPPTLPLAEHLARLGQDLYHPPTVNGWTGGKHWINAATMLERANLATALLASQGAYAGRLDVVAVARKCGYDRLPAAAGFLSALLLQDDTVASVQDRLRSDLPSGTDVPLTDRLRDIARELVTSAEFQVG